MDLETVMESLQGLMDPLIKVPSPMISMMDMVRPYTKTAQNMLVITAEDLGLGMVSRFTLMETDMRVNSKMT